MATKKRKARGGELWAVIDTTAGDIAWLNGQQRPAVEAVKADARWWKNYAFYGDRYEVRKILWRLAPRGKRGN